MILRHVSLFSADCFLPWPKRLLGVDAWGVKVRNKKSALEEYNIRTYKPALDLWEREFSNRPIVRPLQFFQSLHKLNAQKMLEEAARDGKSEDSCLISIEDSVFLTEYKTAYSLQNMIVNQALCALIEKFQISQVVELGCGNGVNLFNLYEKMPLAKAFGGDIASNAVELGNKIAQKCMLPIYFYEFDYYNPRDLVRVTSGIQGDYMIFTCHSIEQISIKKSNLFGNILKLENPPKLVVHLEPILDYNDSNFQSVLAINYSKQNAYNQDLLSMIDELKSSKIKIHSFKKRIFGINPFNPTSLLVWSIA